MSYTNTVKLGNKHEEMRRLLDFYEKEIQFLQKLLTEVVEKNTGKETTAASEHYQNQFMIQLKNLDEYRNRIIQNKHLVFSEISEHAGKVDNRIHDDLSDLEEQVFRFEHIIKELREEFKRFLLQWM